MRIAHELRLRSGIMTGKLVIKESEPERLLESEPYRYEAGRLFVFLQEHLAAGTFDEFCHIVNNRRNVKAINQRL